MNIHAFGVELTLNIRGEKMDKFLENWVEEVFDITEIEENIRNT